MENNNIIEDVFYYKDQELHIENVAVGKILDNYSAPTVIFSKKRLVDNIESIKNAFLSYYPKTKIFFATKACYLPEVIKTMKENGVGSDVSSSYEFKIVKECCVSDGNIVWNSPAKSIDEIESIVESNCLCNVDSVDEVIELNNMAKKHNVVVNVGVRINPNVEINGTYIKKGGKLGIDEETGQAFEVCKLIQNLDNINLVGLHCHISVQNTDPSNQVIALNALVDFAQKIYTEFGVELEYLCPGGGFQNRFMLESCGESINNFARDMTKVLNKLSYSPFLMLEPGRYLIDDAAICIGKIICKKLCKDNTWMITDMGTNLLIPFGGREFDIRAVKKNGRKKECVYVGDRTSSYSGVIKSNVLLESMEKNDFLAAFNCGSYTFSCSQNFMYPLCYDFLIVDDAAVKVILKAKDENYYIKSIF